MKQLNNFKKEIYKMKTRESFNPNINYFADLSAQEADAARREVYDFEDVATDEFEFDNAANICAYCQLHGISAIDGESR